MSILIFADKGTQYPVTTCNREVQTEESVFFEPLIPLWPVPNSNDQNAGLFGQVDMNYNVLAVQQDLQPFLNCQQLGDAIAYQPVIDPVSPAPIPSSVISAEQAVINDALLSGNHF